MAKAASAEIRGSPAAPDPSVLLRKKPASLPVAAVLASVRAFAWAKPGSFFVGMGGGSWMSCGLRFKRPGLFPKGGVGGGDIDSLDTMLLLRSRMLTDLGSLALRPLRRLREAWRFSWSLIHELNC